MLGFSKISCFSGSLGAGTLYLMGSSFSLMARYHTATTPSTVQAAVKTIGNDAIRLSCISNSKPTMTSHKPTYSCREARSWRSCSSSNSTVSATMV
jgi:hypothetical protein